MGRCRIHEFEWRWYGSPGHFICAYRCRFHLCTQVGPWLVSTVGEMLPVGMSKPTADMEYEDIGSDRRYETMVFRAGRPCIAPDCACGQPEIDGMDVEAAGYNDRAAANAGHMAMCRKYAMREAGVAHE